MARTNEKLWARAKAKAKAAMDKAKKDIKNHQPTAVVQADFN